MTRALASLAVCVVLLPASAGGSEPETVPGEFIVHWRSAGRVRPLRRVGADRILRGHAITPTTWVYRLESTSRAARAVIAELQGDPAVALAEPNLVRRPFLKPNDPYYGLQWYAPAIKLESAWDRTTGAGIVVAAVDTGILAAHPDLVDRVLPGYDFISDATSAGDGNGWDDDPTDAGTNATDSTGFHGTRVAGIIAANGNNAIGVAGVNWAAKVLPARALGVKSGKGSDADIAAAVRWAAGLAVVDVPANPNPARIINLSFGGSTISTALKDAISEAQQAGCIVVAAAGNQGQSADNVYPGALPGVIAVGATTYDGGRASYSNYGQAVAIMAPGGDMSKSLPYTFEGKNYPAGILSPFRTDAGDWNYGMVQGTSESAPIVSGAVSLLLAVKPALSSAEVRGLLTTTANTASQCAEGCGAGLLDVDAALAKATAPPSVDGGSSGGKLPFNAACSTDEECADAVCRYITSTSRVCTRFCTLSSSCPAGASCRNGLCAPTSSSLSEPCADLGCGNHNANATIAGGCSIGAQQETATFASLATALLVVGLLVVGQRRTRQRARHTSARLERIAAQRRDLSNPNDSPPGNRGSSVSASKFL